MHKLTIPLLILAGIIIFSLGFIISSSTSDDLVDIHSKCYTSLQPSSYFSSVQIMGDNGSILLKSDDVGFNWHKISNTGSMRPTIGDGGVIITIEPKKEDLRVGDIILIGRNGYSILHRIIKINLDGSYVTKGDNNNLQDEQNWTFEQVKEKVVGILF